jgi:hypothetical protein
MKRCTILSIGILCFAIAAVLLKASSVTAVLPEVGYIGVFKDATHDTNPASGGAGYNVCPAQYEQFQCWIWCLPSWEGMSGAVFAVSFPTTVVILNTVQNPDIRASFGTIVEGIDFVLNQDVCQMDWMWTHQITMLRLGLPTVSDKIEIVPPSNQYMSWLGFYICYAEPFPAPIDVLTPLYICWSPDPGPLGVQETNWGAIKSLF